MTRMILTGGRIVDPRNGIDAVLDIEIDEGRIAAVGRNLASARAATVIDCHGRVVIPGIIDTHVHLSGPNGAAGHRMVVRVGVTTVLDLAGDAESLMRGAAEAGAGLTIAFLEPVVPGGSVGGPDPAHAELSALVQQARRRGALGVKVLGGHYPLTPDATARTIRAAAEHNAYVAVHAGTTAHGSDIDGLEELIQLAEDLPLHVAHVNSYCRGQRTGDPVGESHRALRAVAAAPNVRSEAYLSIMNGTSGRCVDGVPASNVTKTCLEMGGFEPTESGLADAILAGWASVQTVSGGETRLIAGAEGETLWRERGTNLGLSFPVNPPVTSLIMATAKDADGTFVVDAISTDGGAIPRNTIVEQGLPLVRAGALRLEEFVRKTSINPAAMLGVSSKGHLGAGADADVTVLDLDTGRAVLGVAGGELIMVDGVPVGQGARFLTTAEGVAFLEQRGQRPQVIDR
jgi:predicted amidohydrolase